MKKFLFLLFSLLGIIIIPYSITAQPVKIIFDTDMESDVDDVGALAMLHAFTNLGEAEILATISSSLNPWSAPTISAINTFFGRPDIPIGNVKTKGVYRNSKFAKLITELYPQALNLGENAPNATNIYRKVLSEQPDQSVVIVSVGYLTNLSKLLKSDPDKISPLSGKELIAQKVNHYVCMGGRYPFEQNPGKWGNFKPDPEAVLHVVHEWPTPIIFTTGGSFAQAIPTGKVLFTDQVSENNPITKSYQIFLDGLNREHHHSADLIAVYVAIKGPAPYFKMRKEGYFHIFEDGTHIWRVSPDNVNQYIIGEFAEGVDAKQVAKDFDDWMAGGIRN